MLLNDLAVFDGRNSWATWKRDVLGGLLVASMTGANKEERAVAVRLTRVIEQVETVTTEQEAHDGSCEEQV